MGPATVCSMISEDAPGYTALTTTCGGAICGYSAIGKLVKAINPDKVMISEITNANLGRDKKKLLIMIRYPMLFLLFIIGVSLAKLRFCILYF
jgi:hypothetical protein